MENISQETDKKAFYRKLIAACEKGNFEQLSKMPYGTLLTRQFFIEKKIIYPSVEERCSVYIHAVPFMIALKGWNMHPNKQSAQTLDILFPVKMHASLPVVKITFQSVYRPKNKQGPVEKDEKTYTFTLADFIYANKLYLNKQQSPVLLQPFYTVGKMLAQLSDRITKEEPKQVKIVEAKKQPVYQPKLHKKSRYRAN